MHFIPATYQHAETAASILLPKTVIELERMNFEPLTAIAESIEMSTESYTIIHNDNICGMFGLGAFDPLMCKPYAWVLPTIHIIPIIKLYIKTIKDVTDYWLTIYPTLFGLVDNDYKEAKRIFTLAGFREGKHIDYNGFDFVFLHKGN